MPDPCLSNLLPAGEKLARITGSLLHCRKCMASSKSQTGWEALCGCARAGRAHRTASWLLRRKGPGLRLSVSMSRRCRQLRPGVRHEGLKCQGRLLMSLTHLGMWQSRHVLLLGGKSSLLMGYRVFCF